MKSPGVEMINGRKKKRKERVGDERERGVRNGKVTVSKGRGAGKEKGGKRNDTGEEKIFE